MQLVVGGQGGEEADGQETDVVDPADGAQEIGDEIEGEDGVQDPDAQQGQGQPQLPLGGTDGVVALLCHAYLPAGPGERSGA